MFLATSCRRLIEVMSQGFEVSDCEMMRERKEVSEAFLIPNLESPSFQEFNFEEVQMTLR